MKLLIKRLLSHLPTKLPVGITEFHDWADSIIELAGKYANEDSLKFAIATMILHADAKHGFLPKSYFVMRLRKVAANQVASQVFTDIKIKQQEAATAAANQPTVEVTPAVTTEQVTSNVTTAG